MLVDRVEVEQTEEAEGNAEREAHAACRVHAIECLALVLVDALGTGDRAQVAQHDADDEEAHTQRVDRIPEVLLKCFMKRT